MAGHDQDQGAAGSQPRSPRSLPRSPLPLYGERRLLPLCGTRPLQWPPHTVGRYRNTHPVLVNYLVLVAVEKREQDYLKNLYLQDGVWNGDLERNAVIYDIAGRKVAVVPLDDIIRSKEAANREKDRAALPTLRFHSRMLRERAGRRGDSSR